MSASTSWCHNATPPFTCIIGRQSPASSWVSWKTFWLIAVVYCQAWRYYYVKGCSHKLLPPCFERYMTCLQCQLFRCCSYANQLRSPTVCTFPVGRGIGRVFVLLSHTQGQTAEDEGGSFAMLSLELCLWLLRPQPCMFFSRLKTLPSTPLPRWADAIVPSYLQRFSGALLA